MLGLKIFEQVDLSGEIYLKVHQKLVISSHLSHPIGGLRKSQKIKEFKNTRKHKGVLSVDVSIKSLMTLLLVTD